MEWYIAASLLVGAALASWPAFYSGRRWERNRNCGLIRRRCPECIDNLPEICGSRGLADHFRK